MLTIEELKSMKEGEVFRSGTYRLPYSPNPTATVAWVAVRGGTHDWAIYMSREGLPYDDVQEQGDKVTSAWLIRDLVPCTDEAFAWYRY